MRNQRVSAFLRIAFLVALFPSHLWRSVLGLSLVARVPREMRCLNGRHEIFGAQSDLCITSDKWWDWEQSLSAIQDGNTITTGRYAEQVYAKLQVECTNNAPRPFSCANASVVYRPWTDSICTNKRFNGMRTLSHGCSKTCNCCGGEQCDSVHIQAPDNPSTHKKMPLILFFHGYSADSQYSTEHYHLDALNLHNYVVIALNGRQDDQGYPYWLGSSRFAGVMGSINDSGRVTANVDIKQGVNILSEEQRRMLTQDNPDIYHVRSVLAYAMKHYNIDPTRIYALGTALGGDFVNMLACNMSDVFAAVISDHGYGFYDRDSWRHCTPTHPIHILLIESEDQSHEPDVELRADTYLPDVYVPFWASHNGCNKTKKLSTEVWGWNWMKESIKTTYTADEYKMDTNSSQLSDGCAKGGSVTIWTTEGDALSIKSKHAFPKSLLFHLSDLTKKIVQQPLGTDSLEGTEETEDAEDRHKYQGLSDHSPWSRPRVHVHNKKTKKTAINEYVLGSITISLVVLGSCFFCVYQKVAIPMPEGDLDEATLLNALDSNSKECELRNYEAYQNVFPAP